MAGKGGATPGAGRKPKAKELAIIEAMDKALAPSKVWRALAKLVESGDPQAVKTWLNYRFGMPKQSMEVKHEGDILLNFQKAAGCEPLKNG